MNTLSAVSKTLQNKANIGLLLIITVIMVGLGYMITSSVSPSAELMELAHGRNVPDAQFWRTPDTLYTQLTDYGEHGRRLYLTHISPFDLFIPLGQALFLSFAITLVFQRAFKADSRWQLLNTVPFGAMIFDYFENISTVTIMLFYPTRLTALAAAATIFTALKFIISVASIALIPLGLIAWLWGSLRTRNKR
jgi:hypothetical protein